MKKSIIISFFLIVIGLGFNIYDFMSMKKVKEIETKKIDIFLKQDDTFLQKQDDDYIAVLEIPKINLKKGLVDPLSSLNNVDKNIEILKPIEMPDRENHTFSLASHSGTSKVSYFRKRCSCYL